jgi:hypothetical protein
MQLWLDKQPQTFFKGGTVKLNEQWQWCVEVQGEHIKERVLLFAKFL